MNNKGMAFGLLGLFVGVLLTLAGFSFVPWLREKIAGPSPASRQMQVWNEFSANQRQMLEHFDRLFRDDFSDPFFKDEGFFSSGFHMQTSSPGVGELVQREDDKFVYYDLEIEDLNSTTIQTKVENGYLTVNGTVEKKNSDEGFEKTYRSQFHRTFPLPDGIDEKKMELVSEGRRLTFKFPKV